MTNSKAIRILSKYKGITLFYNYDYWKSELEFQKAWLEDHPYAMKKEKDFKTDEIKADDLIDLLKDGSVKSTDYIPNLSLTYSDMCRRIDDYVKKPKGKPVEYDESKAEYDKFMEEHKNDIKKKERDVHNLFANYVNLIRNSDVSRFYGI